MALFYSGCCEKKVMEAKCYHLVPDTLTVPEVTLPPRKTRSHSVKVTAFVPAQIKINIFNIFKYFFLFINVTYFIRINFKNTNCVQAPLFVIANSCN